MNDPLYVSDSILRDTKVDPTDLGPAPKRKREKLKSARFAEPGAVIVSNDGRKAYQVEDDGSYRRLQAIPRVSLMRMIRGAAKSFLKYIWAPAPTRGIYEQILRAKDSQEAASLLLEGSNRCSEASSGTRRKWRRAVEAVRQRERLDRLRRPA